MLEIEGFINIMKINLNKSLLPPYKFLDNSSHKS